jgi:hypothetical protein
MAARVNVFRLAEISNLFFSETIYLMAMLNYRNAPYMTHGLSEKKNGM